MANQPQRIYIVTHVHVDLDAVVSALLLEAILKTEFPDVPIEFAFISQETTLRDVEVNPRHAYEVSGGDWIYHVDCGKSLLDNHRDLSKRGSSASLILAHYRHLDLSEWRDLVLAADLSDSGRYKAVLGSPQIVMGWLRQFKGDDRKVLEHFRSIVDAALATGLVRKRAMQIPTKLVDRRELIPLPAFEDPAGFGLVTKVEHGSKKMKVGVILVREQDHVGTLRYRLSNCDIVISMALDTENIAVVTSGSEGKFLDLLEVGIVQSIRSAEAVARMISLSKDELLSPGGIEGMGWFAHVPNGSKRAISLMCGSDKAPLKTKMQSRLSFEVIISIVLQALEQYLSKAS